MASLQTNMSSNTNISVDEHLWVVNIRRALDEVLEEEAEVPVCIFNVPKSLMSSDPPSYTPQQVALGPYHCWRPELYDMERYKLAAAKRTQRNLGCPSFQSLVDQLAKFEPKIRACYHKYLDFNGETLAWMMAIDVAFLFEFLQIYAIKEGKILSRVSSRMSHLVDYAGRKSAHNAILRDMVMLENQIPLFILRKMMEYHFSSLETGDEMLFSMVMGLCKELSPFKMAEDLPKIEVSDCSHLLDFLSHIIVQRIEDQSVKILIDAVDQDQGDQAIEDRGTEKNSSKSWYLKQVLSEMWNTVSELDNRLISFIKNALTAFRLQLTILCSLPGFSSLKQPVDYLFSSQDKEEIKPENGNSPSNHNSNKPLLVEEITIPSVSELSKAGVRFLPTIGNISTISFDIKTFTLSLPTISIDVNTEVVLRNLVAYETSNGLGPLVFTRYTELMNGIIDTKEDVKLLRERGIILNHLKSDQEAANLWNGMSKSVRMTKVPFLDKMIKDVNKYYNSRWNVRVGKFMKHYVLSSWKFLTFLATILLLLLSTLQAFCSVYSCTRAKSLII